MGSQMPDKNILVKIRHRKIYFPSTYNASDGDEFVVTRSACNLYGLAIYTNEKWISVRDGLLNASVAMQRYLIAYSEYCLVKNDGIRISPILMDVTELQREAIWIPHANRVEIWNPKVDVQCTSLMIDQPSGLSM